jgi:hypothetical protein
LKLKLNIPSNEYSLCSKKRNLIISWRRTICLLYVWPELTNRFFKTPKSPQNEVRDGKIIENEGGLHLGVWSESGFWRSYYGGHKLGGWVDVTRKLLLILFSKISQNLACKNWAVLILSRGCTGELAKFSNSSVAHETLGSAR